MADLEKNINEEENVTPLFVRCFKAIGHGVLVFLKYILQVIKDMGRAISLNPSIPFALLVAVPGILIGLFLTQHVSAANNFNTTAHSITNWSGLELFILELSGCLNIVEAFGIAQKRNLKSSILASIITLIITVCGALWMYAFTLDYVWTKEIEFSAGTSITCVAISVIAPIIGCIGSFITRDRNYKKDEF